MNNPKIAESLKTIGEGFISLSLALAQVEAAPVSGAPVETPDAGKKPRAKKADAAPAGAPATPPPLPQVDAGVAEFEKLRSEAIAFASSPTGGPEKVKALLETLGASRLSDLKPEQFAAFRAGITPAAATNDFI